MAEETSQSESSGKRPEPYIIVFVIGPPGAGKTALCKAITATWSSANFEHVSLKQTLSEIRETGKAVQYDPLPSGLQKLKDNLANNTVIKSHTKVGIILEGVFPHGERHDAWVTGKEKATPHVLVNGFPETKEQWAKFRKRCWQDKKRLWRPSCGAFVIVMDCLPSEAGQRINNDSISPVKTEGSWQDVKDDLLNLMKETISHFVEIEVKVNTGDVDEVAKKVVAKLKQDDRWTELVGYADDGSDEEVIQSNLVLKTK